MLFQINLDGAPYDHIGKLIQRVDQKLAHIEISIYHYARQKFWLYEMVNNVFVLIV